jgi:hypothetical protein
MTSLTIKDFDTAMNLGATNKGAVSKLVKAWEAKNDQRVKRAAGLGLMAVSLAACGGSDDDSSVEPTVYTVAQLKVTESLDAGYEVAVAAGDAGTFTVAELADVRAEIAGAANVAEFQAAVASGSITFSVSDSLANINGVALTGLANLTVSIASPNAGADASSAAINATGTGTVTFDFADTDDTVTLTGSIDGFTTVAVRFGTVDLTGVTLDDSVDVITVSSGVVLTAAQFLALENGIEGGSADSTVQIVITDADDAADVAAAIANLGGTLDASNVEFVRSEDSVLTDAALEALNLVLDAEMEQYASANALPDALADLNAANAAVDANLDDLGEFLVGAAANEDVLALADVDLSGEIDGQEAVTTTNITTANDANAATVSGGVGATFNALTDAQQAAEIDLDRTDLQTDVDDAEVALAEAAEALEFGVAELIADAELALATKVAADAALVLAQADLPGAEGAVDAVLSAGTITAGASNYVAASGANLGNVLTATNGVWSIAATGVTLVNGVYTIALTPTGTVTVRAVELDALLVVLNAIEAADVAVTAADTALVDAVNAAIDAQDPTNVVTWTTAGIVNDVIDYTPNANAGVLDDYATAVGALDDAETALSDFNDAVTAWEATNALADELAALQATGLELVDAVTAAEEAIENAVDDADAPGLGIDIIAQAAFDAAGGQASVDELYLFDAADANNGAIVTTNFGADGTDRIYFGEETYTFTELDEDIDFTESLGSASALEIFAFEDVTGVTLYVENVSAAGNGTTDADFTEISFAGLTLADMSFSTTTNILVSVESLV